MAPAPADQEDGVEQHGEKQQLHMLPHGFVDGDKKACHDIAAGPVIQEMGQGPCDQHENHPCNGISFETFTVHGGTSCS